MSEKLAICNNCKHRTLAFQRGMMCSLTDALPDFETSCSNFEKDSYTIKQEIKDEDHKKNSKRTSGIVIIAIVLVAIKIILKLLAN